MPSGCRLATLRWRRWQKQKLVDSHLQDQDRLYP